MAVGEGFMQFARGWNSTVRGWGNDIAGSAKQLYGSAVGDDETAIRGVIDDQVGDGQTERGWNMMGGGIKEMLGLIEHGPAPEEAIEESDGGGGAGGGSMCSTGGGGGVPDYSCYEGLY